MRILGCLEMGGEWRFDSLHVRGVGNEIADGISRWEHADVNTNLCASWPGVVWREQVLGSEVAELCTAIFIGRQLIEHSITDSSERTFASDWRAWRTFRRMIGRGLYLQGGHDELVQALVEFVVAWCLS